MFIVVDDPSGNWWEGSLVEDEARMRVLEGEGISLLPVMPMLMRQSGVGGFFKRAWGSGIDLSNQNPQVIAPMILYVDPLVTTINWLVRLMPDPKIQGIRKFNGILRLMHDPGQPHAPIGGLSGARTKVELTELPAPDARGGWTIRGEYDIRPHAAGHIGLAIFGTAPGLRVIWSAVSASR